MPPCRHVLLHGDSRRQSSCPWCVQLESQEYAGAEEAEAERREVCRAQPAFRLVDSLLAACRGLTCVCNGG